MPLPILFAFSFVVGFGAVVTPGPVSTAIVTESARRGFVVGPLVAAGHCLLELGMVILLGLGLAAGLNVPAFTTVIGVLGGALLIWMGSAMAWGAYRGSTRLPRPGADVRLLTNRQLVALGVAATLINPFWYAWWITVGAAYLAYPAVQALGLTGLLVFYLGHISGDLLWDSILSGVVGRGRCWLTDTAYRWLIAACGAYLMYLGLVFAATPFTG
jgi:threonine/homoserine/homoserine lactone efflux protein